MQLAAVPVSLLPDAMPNIERWLGPVVARPGCDLSIEDMTGLVERREAIARGGP